MTATENKDVQELTFEEAYRSLQELVDRLEESLQLFERGTQLVRRCTDILDGAELKIKTLSQDLGGLGSGPASAAVDSGRITEPAPTFADPEED